MVPSVNSFPTLKDSRHLNKIVSWKPLHGERQARVQLSVKEDE